MGLKTLWQSLTSTAENVVLDSSDIMTAGTSTVKSLTLSVNDYGDMMRQETMKALLGIESDDVINDDELNEYLARKERINDINARTLQAMRKR